MIMYLYIYILYLYFKYKHTYICPLDWPAYCQKGPYPDANVSPNLPAHLLPPSIDAFIINYIFIFLITILINTA